MRYVVRTMFPGADSIDSLPFDTIEEADEYAHLEEKEYEDYCAIVVVLREDEA